MAVNPSIRVDARTAISALTILQGRVEPAVKDAIEKGAALVQAHARDNHPKISDKTLNLVRKMGRDRVSILRTRTGFEAGRFAGNFRFLTRTGVLRNSIKIARAKRIRTGFQAEVFSIVKYANKIEFGTTKTRAFPFLRPALEANRRKIQDLVVKAVGGVTRRPLR